MNHYAWICNNFQKGTDFLLYVFFLLLLHSRYSILLFLFKYVTKQVVKENFEDVKGVLVLELNGFGRRQIVHNKKRKQHLKHCLR